MSLDIRVEIAPDAAPDGDPALWQWLDISAYRRQSADITINTGRDDEAAQTEPGDSSATLNLRDGLLSPRNALSELYGRIGVNTPLRYRLRIGYDDFDRTYVGGWSASSSGHSWSTGVSYNGISGGSGKVALPSPNTASTATLQDLGAIDIDVVYSVSLSAVTTGAQWISAVELRKVDTSNLYRVYTELKPAGVITTKIVRTLAGVGTSIGEDLTVTGTYSAGSKVWTRAQAIGAWLRSKVWTGLLTDEPDDWNVSVQDAGAEGSGFGFYQWRFSGNTNVGTLTASIDDLTIDTILWEGNVPEWSPNWDKSGNDSTTALVAAGPLRRLSAGNQQIKSPLAQQLPVYGPAGYWPCEDAAGSDQIASGIPGGREASHALVTLGADSDALPGAATMAKIDSSATRVTGRCKSVSYNGWAGLVFYKFPSLPVDVRLIEWETTGTIRWWQLSANGGEFYLQGFDSTNIMLVNTTGPAYGFDPTETFSIQVEAVQDGSNIDWTVIWNRVGVDTGFLFFDGTVAGSVGRPLGFKINGVTHQDALFGHIWMGPASLPYVNTTFRAVASGYPGETARARVARICAEAGVPVALYPGTGEAVGRQRPGPFLELLRETIKADLGLLLERGGTIGVVPRSARYNKPVAMALDWTGGDLAEAPKPTDDDQRLRNQWTISRTNGSSATDERDWGANSVARRGRIPDADEVNINLDNRLRHYVGWYLNLTTYDDFRWPTIELDLVAHPELIPAFLGCRVGSRITIANPKAQVPGITIDLLIEGIKQTIGRHKWRVSLTCSPALPWDVAIYDSLTKRKDSRNSTLNASYSSSAASMVVTFTNLRDQWSQTNEPYLWDLKGETVRVDSMGAVTGSGPYTQTATVTRGINGVAKPHTAGDPVHIHPTQLARYAL
jgi:hypothetical protein